MKLIAVLPVLSILAGCASVVNDTTHPMRIETKRPDGTLVSGADCTLSNDYGAITAKSGTAAPVRRSSKDLDITCKYPSTPDAVGRAISRANAGMAGNIILGGGIGAIIDHNKGTAYTYPTWVQLVFGQSLVFDRSSEKEGQPVMAMQTGLTESAAGDAPKSSTTVMCVRNGTRVGDRVNEPGGGSLVVREIAAVNTQCPGINGMTVQALVAGEGNQAHSAQATSVKATIGDTTSAQTASASLKLRELNTMLKDGLITQQDYDLKKKELLKSF